MRTRTNYSMIGAFIIGGVAVLVTWVMSLEGASDAKSFYFETYFEESITGLTVGSPVRFRGVRIGLVDQIHLAANVYATQKPYVVVVGKLYQRGVPRDKWRNMLDRRLPEGLFVRLSAEGLTGGNYLEADLPGEGLPRPERLPHDWRPLHEYVPSERSTIGQLRITLEELALNIRKIDFAALFSEAQSTMKSIRTQVDQAQVGQISQKIQSLLDNGKQAVDSGRQILARAGSRADLVLDELSGLLKRVDQAVDSKAVKNLVADLSSTAQLLPGVAKDVKAAMESLMQSAEQLEEMIRLKGRDVDLILENVRVVTANLARLAGTLERYPSLLLFGKPPQQATVPGGRK